jgi:glucose/arabinose dehydrogenase
MPVAKTPYKLMCALIAAFGPLSDAAWQYPGCADVTEADFKYEDLVRKGTAPDPGLNEPIKMAFGTDAEGNVDVYWGERTGNIKVYRGKDKTVTLLGKAPAVQTGDEKGFLGIALDPQFAVNRRLYLFFVADSPREFRLAGYGEPLA